MLVGNAGSPHSLLQAHFPSDLFPQLRGFNRVMGPVEFGTRIEFEGTTTAHDSNSVARDGGRGGGTGSDNSSSPVELCDDDGCTAAVRKLHDGYVL